MRIIVLNLSGEIENSNFKYKHQYFSLSGQFYVCIVDYKHKTIIDESTPCHLILFKTCR